MSTFMLHASGVHWLDRCHEGIQRMEFDYPATWWFAKNIGDRYYAFEPECWSLDRWLGPNKAYGAGESYTPAKVRYAMITGMQLWEWLRRGGGKEGIFGLLDWERRCVLTCSCLAYYDYLTRKYQYHVQDQRIKVRMARRIA